MAQARPRLAFLFDQFDPTGQPGGPGQVGIACQQGAVERFGEGHVDGVVRGEVLPKRPDSIEQRFVRVPFEIQGAKKRCKEDADADVCKEVSETLRSLGRRRPRQSEPPPVRAPERRRGPREAWPWAMGAWSAPPNSGGAKAGFLKGPLKRPLQGKVAFARLSLPPERLGAWGAEHDSPLANCGPPATKRCCLRGTP